MLEQAGVVLVKVRGIHNEDSTPGPGSVVRITYLVLLPGPQIAFGSTVGMGGSARTPVGDASWRSLRSTPA
jgi:hypothetical protein